jgi:streptomycin 6-kinase
VTENIVPMVDLAVARSAALDIAERWHLSLGEPFALSNVSYVVAVGDDQVLKVNWEGDDESLHEADALAVWSGDGAVRLIRAEGRAVLEQRIRPGDDLSLATEEEACAVVTTIAQRLWRTAGQPFRSVQPSVRRWIDEGETNGSTTASLARELLKTIEDESWLVHGDLHHHNVLRSVDGYLAIDPKPFLANREYDVAPFLWNPINHVMSDRSLTEGRIRAYVNVGLDDALIRKWAVIRGSYLRFDEAHTSALLALL